MNEDGAAYERMHLGDWFNNPHPMLKKDVYDGVLRGLVLSNPHASDDLFSNEVSCHFMVFQAVVTCSSLCSASS